MKCLDLEFLNNKNYIMKTESIKIISIILFLLFYRGEYLYPQIVDLSSYQVTSSFESPDQEAQFPAGNDKVYYYLNQSLYDLRFEIHPDTFRNWEVLILSFVVEKKWRNL